MKTSIPETIANSKQSYCFNPKCQQPENKPDAQKCLSCRWPLQLNDRYRAVRLIGQGGFGRTLLAVDESQLSRPYCVVKQFFPQQQGNTEKAAELFRQEAHRLEALGTHAQIPKLLAFFETEHKIQQETKREIEHEIEHEIERWQYLVQEFVDGRNLAQELAENGVLSELQIRQLLQDILLILKFIHSHQVIHRDIKPENIVRRGSDRKLVLVDFGAAKYTSETTLGKTGTMIGSAAYTAPEQVRGKAVYASDLFSLGVTCIHLLTQMSPFELFDGGENKWIWQHYLKKSATNQITNDESIKTSQKNRSKKFAKSKTQISEQLATILNKLLESGTTRRYQSAEAVLKDLQAKPNRRFKKRWLVAGAMLVGSVAGARSLLFPVAQMVSNPTAYEAARSQQASAIGGLYLNQMVSSRLFRSSIPKLWRG
ncbi:MAG: serine/threonine protein kinase [Leptolyngbyaceae cyanobacterium CSU_1_3]|nr:serine/threonine protein kinase [Leptolyngbyaceae cyanobacterium CSU_1_3]